MRRQGNKMPSKAPNSLQPIQAAPRDKIAEATHLNYSTKDQRLGQRGTERDERRYNQIDNGNNSIMIRELSKN